MHTFKPGDRVRRIRNSFGGVVLGNEYTVHKDTGDLTLKLEGVLNCYAAEAFELVAPAGLSDEATAAAFRVAYEQMSVARNALIERGYTIQFEGFNGTPLKASTLGKKFKINKTVTTVKDI